MDKIYPTASAFWSGKQPSKAVSLARAWRFLLLLGAICGLTLGQAAASHFRYGNISWRVVQSDPTKRTIEFRVTQAWQGTPALGEAPFETMFNFGDRRSQTINVVATSVNTAENYFFGESIFTHTYSSSSNYLVSFSACCRIPDLVNNPGGSYYISTLVNTGSGNSSPVSTLSPIVNVPAGTPNATFNLPANDPDGDPLTYTLATRAEMGGIVHSQPAGLAIDPVTGVVTFNTVNKTVGQLYTTAIKVSDGKTSIIVDFLLKLTPQSSVPQFDYSVMPANGFIYQVPPGQTISFPVKAIDNDPKDVVTLRALGMPSGSKMSAPLPTSGNPVQSNFSWTPGTNNLGTSVINFVAQDSLGAQANSSVTIQVSMRPVFDTPPTPLKGSTTQIVPGKSLQYTIQATNPDPNGKVQLVAAQNLPAGAVLSPALPTVAGRSTSTQLNWTPTVADWGKRSVGFTAANSYGERTDHAFDLVVNTPPGIVSAPVTRVMAGQPYSYSVQANDPDVAYGDVLKILATTKPAWLTITDNGKGSATLSGTPQETDAGTFRVVLLVEDKYHHGYDQALATQTFDLQVILCNTTLTAAGTDITCNGQRNGAINLAVSGGTAPFVYSWTGPDSFTAATASLTGLAPGTYTATVTDANQCVSTTRVTLTEPAPEPIVFKGPSDLIVATAAGECGAQVEYIAPIGTHSCQNVTTTMTGGFASGALFPVGTTPVTYRAVTSTGDTASYRFTVTVQDKQAPVAKAQNLTVALVNGSVSITADQVNNGSTDACGIRSLSVSPQRFTCADAGANTVTLTITDNNGNVATTTATVTVVGGATSAPDIAVTPSNTVYTGGAPTTLYLGYGPQSATLTASGGVSYRWSPATGLSNAAIANPVFQATAAGTYTYSVVITNQYGCTVTKAITMKVVDVRCGNGGKNDKVLVCHNGHEICISANAVPAHLDNPSHDDQLGSCLGGEPSKNSNGDNSKADEVSSSDAEFEASPNPFVTTTTIQFRAPQTTTVMVRLYNSQGFMVATLYNGVAQAGRKYSLTLEGRSLKPGIYICQLVMNGKTETQRLWLTQ